MAKYVTVYNREHEKAKDYTPEEFKQQAFNLGLISQHAFETLDLRVIVNLVRVARKHLDITIY